MYHEIDTTQTPVTVVTFGSNGQQIGRTTWPDIPSALAYAERMSALCGGDVLSVA